MRLKNSKAATRISCHPHEILEPQVDFLMPIWKKLSILRSFGGYPASNGGFVWFFL
jgi:hypothetical protein